MSPAIRTCHPAVAEAAGRRLFAAVAMLMLSSSVLPTPATADGDPDTGEAVYQRCIGCHSLDRNRTGPRHCGLIGRKAGTLDGFAYSEAMRESDLVWNADTLDAFLAAPLEKVPGTTMGFAGISDPEARQNLIAYLIKVNARDGRCGD